MSESFITPTQTPVKPAGQSQQTIGSIVQATPGYSRQHTPFRKTPTVRSIRGTSRLTETPATKTEPGSFAGILNKTWKIHYSTPMYQFSSSQDSLRQYGRLLSAHIQAEQQRGLAVETESADSARLDMYKGLKQYADDPDAVYVLLTDKKQGSKNQPKTVFHALLCGITDDMSSGGQQTHYPLLLTSGPVGLGRHVISWLQTQFDCCISPVQLTTVNLSWLLTLWTSTVKVPSRRSFELVYQVPDEVKDLDKITVNMEAQACKGIWTSIHTEEEDEVHIDEVSAFIKSLEQHFFTYFNILIMAMPLIRVGTPVAMAGIDGKIKIFDEDQVIPVLLHLSQMAMEKPG